MKQRLRTKTTESVYGNLCTTTSVYKTVTESISDQVPGPGPCTHERLLPYRSEFSCASRGDGWIKPTYRSAYSTIAGNSSHFNSLNWSKLPTSTAAGIIQILAEIDDTIAIFTKKFWTALSYGSITWGVLPFVSEVRSLANTIKNLSANLEAFRYEDSYPISADIKSWVPGSCIVGDLKYQGTVKYTGTATLPDNGLADDLLALLDRIGLHPDLATLWDLLPLSFVADYFLPIGDYLETFRQGGWIKAIYFSGWCSFNVDTELIVRPTGACGNFVTATEGGKGHVYSRKPVSTVLFYQPEHNSVHFDLPSPIQLFNTLYVILAGKR